MILVFAYVLVEAGAERCKTRGIPYCHPRESLIDRPWTFLISCRRSRCFSRTLNRLISLQLPQATFQRPSALQLRPPALQVRPPALQLRPPALQIQPSASPPKLLIARVGTVTFGYTGFTISRKRYFHHSLSRASTGSPPAIPRAVSLIFGNR